MAELFADVRATLEQAAALTCADVLGFEHVVHRSWCRVQRALLALSALSFGSLAFTGAASLVTAVAATVQECATDAHTLRCFIFTLVAD